MRCLVTGATGCVGSHVAETLLRQGHKVVALVREGSDSSWLESLGVEVERGELGQAAAARRALRDVDVVVHCAAKVGDWGPIDEYRRVNVEGLRQLLDACPANLHRFVHLSSLGVYAARDHFGTDETAPLPRRHVDGYTQSKVEAETVALERHRTQGAPVVVLRPGFIYGPRDRVVLPKLCAALAMKQVVYLGSGTQAMNCIYVGNLVDAVLLAIESPRAVGQTYNLTDGERVTKRRFLESVADLAGLERPSRSVPLPLAKLAASFMEGLYRTLGTAEPPRITKARIKFLGLNLDFSIEKAKRELGYQPRVGFDEGMEEAVAWWKSTQSAGQPQNAVARDDPVASAADARQARPS